MFFTSYGGGIEAIYCSDREIRIECIVSFKIFDKENELDEVYFQLNYKV